MKKELTHYRADELFNALEIGRRFMVGGNQHIVKWERREMLDGDYEYFFDFNVAHVTGRADMRLGCVEFMVPMIHLNGSDADELLDGVTEGMSKLVAAMETLRRNGPHLRDYYAYAMKGAFDAAQEQHADRLKRVESVLKELEKMAEAICDAKYRRAAMKAGR
jgi:hypothetical protein